ncbi:MULTISPECIES: hypothetical protein [unclassified Myroides]|uniref:hypothetical protein n=1 Tax=unclassified Myroides TaxID=2642485 RepID=UPI003D2F7F44
MTKNFNLSDSDFSDLTALIPYIRQIDTLEVKEALQLSRDILQYQPFFLSVVFGYQTDLSLEEHDEVLRLYFLLWLYFKEQNKLPSNPVTQANFEQTQKQLVQMLAYVQQETEDSKQTIFSNDLKQIQSRAMVTALYYRFETRPVLKKMNEEMKSLVIMGFCGFIKCFECNKLTIDS